jgi:hypothetical protein
MQLPLVLAVSGEHLVRCRSRDGIDANQIVLAVGDR